MIRGRSDGYRLKMSFLLLIRVNYVLKVFIRYFCRDYINPDNPKKQCNEKVATCINRPIPKCIAFNSSGAVLCSDGRTRGLVAF